MFAAGSQTTWFVPMTSSSGLTRKTVEVETVDRSIDPLSGIEILGWMLNPSSWSRTSTSAQSLGRAPQSGFGRLTRKPVSCVESVTVSRFVGNGWPALTAATATPGRTSAAAKVRSAARKIMRMKLPLLRWTRRRYSIDPCVAYAPVAESDCYA